MRTIKVSQISVYHKYAEVEVTIPNDIADEDVGEWLVDNENEYNERIDSTIDEACYQFGLPHWMGVNSYNGKNQTYLESEWRYDVEVDGKLTIGGHL